VDVDTVRRAIHATGRKTRSTMGDFEFVWCWHFADFIADRLGVPRVFGHRVLADGRIGFTDVDPDAHVHNRPACMRYGNGVAS